MAHLNGDLIFIAFCGVVAGILYFQRWMLETLIEAMNNFRGGGPPPPQHPCPSNDGALLRRRLRAISRR